MGWRTGRRQLRNRIAEQVDRRARGAKSNAAMTQARAATACRSTRNRQEGVLPLLRMLAATGALVAAITSSAIAGDVSGAGATFPYPIYAKWAEAYKKQTGITVHYQSIGSGEGIRQIQNKEVTFGASDMPLKAADLDMYGLVQFPTAIGGAVPLVNVEAVKAADLTLARPTLARNVLGQIHTSLPAALRTAIPRLSL